jgi:hypothetical protein
MIISQILGGLGNQMFQYAAGRALSLSSGFPLLLDLRGFEKYQLHNGFEIDKHFYAPVDVATAADVSRLLGWRANKLILKLIKHSHSHRLQGSHLAIEPHFNYWHKLGETTKPSYLMGYWQSEKYFKAFEKTIRSDFCFREPLVGDNLETSLQMQDSNSVSLHIRRGDYVTHAPSAKVFNPCSIDYYHEAIELIAEKVSSPRFYVFSDDHSWAKGNLKTTFATEYIDRNHREQSYIDMRLMSMCRHQIIANSSFSWWGAWLNQNPDKIVISPRNWFRNGVNDDDLIPRQWIRL